MFDTTPLHWMVLAVVAFFFFPHKAQLWCLTVLFHCIYICSYGDGIGPVSIVNFFCLSSGFPSAGHILDTYTWKASCSSVVTTTY